MRKLNQMAAWGYLELLIKPFLVNYTGVWQVYEGSFLMANNIFKNIEALSSILCQTKVTFDRFSIKLQQKISFE